MSCPLDKCTSEVIPSLETAFLDILEPFNTCRFILSIIDGNAAKSVCRTHHTGDGLESFCLILTDLEMLLMEVCHTVYSEC